MTTRKYLCVLALPAFIFCGEAAAKSNKAGGASKQATSAAGLKSNKKVLVAPRAEVARSAASPSARGGVTVTSTPSKPVVRDHRRKAVVRDHRPKFCFQGVLGSEVCSR